MIAGTRFLPLRLLCNQYCDDKYFKSVPVEKPNSYSCVIIFVMKKTAVILVQRSIIINHSTIVNTVYDTGLLNSHCRLIFCAKFRYVAISHKN